VLDAFEMPFIALFVFSLNCTKARMSPIFFVSDHFYCLSLFRKVPREAFLVVEGVCSKVFSRKTLISWDFLG
jgi:hypothetical protein